MANWSEVKSLMSSTKSDGSSAPMKGPWRNAALHERCSMMDMVKLREAFQEAYLGRLLPNEFRTILRTLLNVEYDDDEYKILFMKINTARNGEIDWDELVSHLILGYFGNDPENQRGTLELPILGLPTLMRSQHRHPISRICFCPDVAKDRTTDPMQGSYVTVSRDGQVHWWSLDMRLRKSAQSSSPFLKVRTTWVTDLACLPDVNIVCTSSTERDLRFYDCTAGNFTLKIIITSWEYMICTLNYHFSADPAEPCLLFLGDAGGHVRLLSFSPYRRGPFANEAGRALTQLRHVDLQKRPHLLPLLRLTELGRAHADWVRQLAYYAPLHAVLSCATARGAMLLRDLGASKTYNMYYVDKGIQCFAIDTEAHIIATGSPDCVVRLWSPFVPARPSLALRGHRAAVTGLVLQGRERAYSLSSDRVIKAWDIQGQTCLQTYIDIPSQIGERVPIAMCYNPATHDLLLGGIMLASLVLDEQLNPAHTDGTTHTKAVSKVLYNPLFKVVVTCGLDSIIICWDPVTGKRNAMVRDAHTNLLHGAEVPVEVTAACFDPGYQLLLTGARDGTLKVWNFNTGLCLRNMAVEHMCEVTNVFWVEGRILAVGWNRHVTEFEDTGTGSTGKAWETRHSDDVLAAAARAPLVLATASYSSELLLWKLETGQPYRRFSCTDPMLRIKLSYSKRDAARAAAAAAGPAPPARGPLSPLRRPSASSSRSGLPSASSAISKARARRASSVLLPAPARVMRQLAAHAAVYLETRPSTSRIASLMISLENGQIQCWSDHPAGGFQGSFEAVHAAGDYVAALATDVKNDYLFCGTTTGYVKVWLMTNYKIGQEVHVNMPALRLEFPFLWRDRVPGRAKRRARDQPLPLLLNSYRAHLRSVTSLAYLDDMKLLLTGSSDYSVRVWRLAGEYLGTLGSFQPWSLDAPRFPPDVRKVASSTTLKVWQHGQVSRFTPGQAEVDKLRDITEQELRARTFGAPPPEPLLGRYFALPPRPDRQDAVVLDASLQTIPIYTHLRMASTQPLRRPPTPPLVRDTRLRRQPRRTHFTHDAPAAAPPPPPPPPPARRSQDNSGGN